MTFLSRLSRTMRDLCLIVMGALTLWSTPASIDAGLGHEPLTTLWSLLLIAGGSTCLVGAVWRAPLVEVTGCTLAGVAFATWASAAVAQDHPTVTSWVIAFLLISGVWGQLYRGAEVVKAARPVDWTVVPYDPDGGAR